MINLQNNLTAAFLALFFSETTFASGTEAAFHFIGYYIVMFGLLILFLFIPYLTFLKRFLVIALAILFICLTFLLSFLLEKIMPNQSWLGTCIGVLAPIAGFGFGVWVVIAISKSNLKPNQSFKRDA